MPGEGGAKPAPRIFSFGPFVLDVEAHELRKHGVKLKLGPSPYRLLLSFLEQPNQVIKTAGLKDTLWPKQNVDDVNLRSMIKRLRSTLGDAPPDCKYIETVQTIGYKFIAEVTATTKQPDPIANPLPAPTASVPIPQVDAKAATPRFYKRPAFALTIVFAVLAASFAIFKSSRTVHFSQHDQLLVADFENRTTEAQFDGSLMTAFIVGLEQSGYASVYPNSHLRSALAPSFLPK
jgi:DNA-binding winged helix-turn-helix (wHTH) protein